MLAEFITQRMEALGLRQRDLAQKSTLSPQYISDLVNGKRGARMSAVTQTKLARALRVSASRMAECVADSEPTSGKPNSGAQDAQA